MDPRHLLDVARHLARPSSKGGLKQAAIRRSISTSYYAAFNWIQYTVADTLIGKSKFGTKPYIRAFRAVEHKTVRSICNKIRNEKARADFAKELGVEDFPEKIVGLAESFVTLQEAREAADYASLGVTMAWSNAEEMIAHSEDIMVALANAPPNVLLGLVAAIAFKERSG
jgi:hypothetical protein